MIEAGDASCKSPPRLELRFAAEIVIVSLATQSGRTDELAHWAWRSRLLVDCRLAYARADHLDGTVATAAMACALIGSVTTLRALPALYRKICAVTTSAS